MSAPWTPEPGLTRRACPPRAVEARLDYRAWLASLPGREFPCKPRPTTFPVVGRPRVLDLCEALMQSCGYMPIEIEPLPILEEMIG